MLNLVNETPFEARAVPLRDKEGRPVVVFVVKGTYDLTPDGGCKPAQEQAPLVEADEHHGDPASSSVRNSSPPPNSQMSLPGLAFSARTLSTGSSLCFSQPR